MIINSDIEYLSYLYARNNVKYFNLIKRDIIEDEVLRECYDIDKFYLDKYGAFPSYENLIEIFKSKYYGKLSDNDINLKIRAIKTIFERDISKYDSSWLDEVCRSWIRLKSLESSIYDAVLFMKQKVTLDNVSDYVDKVLDIILEKNNIVFDDNIGIGLFDIEKYFKKDEDIKFSGYRFLDKAMGGGWKGKTLTCLIAPPKRGKTLWLCNLAVNMIKSGYNVLYVTFEMSDVDILYRIASNIFEIPISKFYQGIDINELKNKFKSLKKLKIKFGNLIIKEFPTSSIGANDLELYIRNLINYRNITLDLVVIDYINIMKNYRNPSNDNTYLKIKQISEDLRAISQRLSVPIVTASQTIRNSYNSSDIDMEDISESSGLLHTADNVFAIIQTDDHRSNNIYYCKSLCLRYSGFVNIKQKFTVDYEYMRIEESESGYIDNVNETDPF